MKIGNLKESCVTGGFWSSWLLLIVAALIGAPLAGFCLAFLAVSSAVIPLAFGSTKQRLGAAISLLLSLLLAFSLANNARHDPYFNKQRTIQTPRTN